MHRINCIGLARVDRLPRRRSGRMYLNYDGKGAIPLRQFTVAMEVRIQHASARLSP